MSRLTADRFTEFFQALTLAVAGRELAERLVREPGYKPEKPPASKDPFPWQKRLASRVCAPGGAWPPAIALPTAAGKTACIDVAVFALACQAGDPARTAPRRLFFVVDRRVVVDQAYEHAKKLAAVLDRAADGVLRTVADVLLDIGAPKDREDRGWLDLPLGDRERLLAERRRIIDERDPVKRARLWEKVRPDDRPWVEARPLDVYALRGGMYREDTWARSPLQPTVVTSTVDQVGSRLLFRGYGVSDSMKPVHAGLVGNDALILLDEAHCSAAFAETAAAVARYRGWNASLAPFTFVQMTATPGEDIRRAEEERKRDRPGDPPLIEHDQDADRAHPVLGKRIAASKPAKLVVTDKVKGNNWREPLARKLVEEARGQMGRSRDGADEVRAVGVIVNRVATARDVAERLSAGEEAKPEGDRADVLLLTGRMRPLDRDRLLDRLRPLFTGSDVPLERRTYVVATQCLEVGADLDFHALVTECASLDALRQRFGRLNRHAQQRRFAPATVVIRADQVGGTSDDPVYGCSLSNTWQWLLDNSAEREDGAERVQEIDFGVAEIRAKWDATPDDNKLAVLAPADCAPVLLPAHLDCWVQTSPRPTPDPDPALFLHGPQRPGVPDVQVVFRADLGDDPEQWAEVVALCPPSSSEALPVRIDVFRRWLANEDEVPEDLSDEEGTGRDGDTPKPARAALRWASPEEAELVRDADDVRPTATYVVPAAAGGLAALGDTPPEGMAGERPLDYADAAFQRSRDRAILRLTPAVVAQWPEVFRTPAVQELSGRPGIPEDEEDEVAESLDTALDELAGVAGPPAGWEWLPRAAAALLPEETGTGSARRKRDRRREVESHPSGGLVVTGKRRLGQFDPTFADDESSTNVERKVALEAHTRDVVAFARRFALGCDLPPDLRSAIKAAAWWHDLGKADPRFQAMLHNCSPWLAAGFTESAELLAKSGSAPRSRREAELRRQVHRYPRGGRHEVLSVALLEGKADDLVLHLIAAHHGQARPFFDPPLPDDPTDPRLLELLTDFRVGLFGRTFGVGSAVQDAAAANAALPARFWRAVRAHGWWGSAYLESVLRLADHAASAAEQEEGWRPKEDDTPPALPAPAPRPRTRELMLAGLDGSNPLAFLAAVGTLRLADQLYPGVARMRWRRHGRWVPVLDVPDGVDRPKFLDGVAGRLDHLRDHPALTLGRLQANNLVATPSEYREVCLAAAESAGQADRTWADYCAAFGTDVPGPDGDRGQMQDTAFRTMSGAGHQDFLAFFRNITREARRGHVDKALFDPWRYDDPLRNLTTRWDPQEDVRYALRWRNPGEENALRSRSGSVLGANRLAIEGLRLFPCAVVAGRLATTGFRGRARSDTFLSWPVWQSSLTLDTLRGLLALSELHAGEPDRPALGRFGVAEVFRSQRITQGKYRNLGLAKSV